MYNTPKIIRYLFLFLALYYGVYALLFNFIFRGFPLIYYIQKELTVNPDQNTATFLNFDKQIQYDILFFGSSHAYRSFDTQLFKKYGFNTYNLGTVAQTPLNSWHMLKNLPVPPKQLILEIYPPAINASGKEAFFYLDKNLRDYQPLMGMAWDLKDLRCLNLLSIKPFIDSYIKKAAPADVLNSKGYVSTVDSTFGNINYPAYILDTVYTDKQIGYIEKIIRYCSEKNVSVVLVYAPVPKELSIHGEAAFIRRIVRLCADSNIPFANYGRKHALTSGFHFCDNNHLNQAGVNLFNTDLIHKYFLNSLHE